MITTPITTLLGIRHPILLAPMGDTAGGRLAAAVSAAGGLGLIGGGYADPDWLTTELAAAGDACVGVGVDARGDREEGEGGERCGGRGHDGWSRVRSAL